jgi:NADH:ubiquinone oxidoreductase subunit 5 (subunit L)/multisubunit Na+/H+ antiporter MnhA subunit
MVIGTLTMLIARVRALFEIDLKKMVALSTLRQLGVIILRLGLGAFIARFFHLLTHAFFKALLFLATGRVIHRSNSYQDLRVMGRARKIIPLTRRFIIVSLLRLIGLPFMSAFFSKELILETLLIDNFNFFVYIYIVLGVSLTALYSARFIYIGMVNSNKNEQVIFKSDEDTPLVMSMRILMAPAMIAGALLSLTLFPVSALRSSPINLKLRIIFLILTRLGVRVLLTKKFNSTLWRKQL